MITTYHRPATLDEALRLLAQPNTLPLGGGTLLSRGGGPSVEVVDLQALGLNTLARKGNDLEIGAMVTLQQLAESPECPADLKAAIKLEAPLNLRNSASVAGTLVSCTGRSTFAGALLALDAKLTLLNPASSTLSLGEYLPLRPGGLITTVTIPAQARFAFDKASRTPSDRPIIFVSLARWPSGRARLAVGGFGASPALAMDGTEAEGLDTAARNACHDSADEYASAEYRMDVAAALASRCLARLAT